MEEERRMPAELVTELRSRGFFAACIPRSLGGEETHVAEMVQLIEEVSSADGSAGWTLMIGVTSAVVAGYLPEAAAGEIYGKPGVITGGVFAPKGNAILRGENYLASGRWPFASGCEHSDWLMGGCIIEKDGSPQTLPSGVPDPRLLIFPRSQARIHDTWTVSGLCGTGSHDIEINELEVPTARSVSLLTDEPREPGPLYKFPVFGLLALGVAAVTLGIARCAITELRTLAAGKTPTGARRRLAERSAVQAEVARAEAGLGAARAYMLEAIAHAWEEAEGMGEARDRLPVPTRARLRLAATHAAQAATAAVDRMYDAGGGTSIYKDSPLQRCFRDVHTATQHIMVQPATWELVGRTLLEVETDTSML